MHLSFADKIPITWFSESFIPYINEFLFTTLYFILAGRTIFSKVGRSTTVYNIFQASVYQKFWISPSDTCFCKQPKVKFSIFTIRDFVEQKCCWRPLIIKLWHKETFMSVTTNSMLNHNALKTITDVAVSVEYHLAQSKLFCVSKSRLVPGSLNFLEKSVPFFCWKLCNLTIRTT